MEVLSHNLYTVLNIPHDPVALEEHFQDDDDGPVSNHGYMPYLNKYILDKVESPVGVANAKGYRVQRQLVPCVAGERRHVRQGEV